ncbi:MAG: TPM domain-containing protein [Deltaproteobacteria bacterium]|nr:TPM domain-containing protein [Deltaproteobacteria bacterium]
MSIRCPRCETRVQDATPKCASCGFGIEDLDLTFGQLPARNGLVNDFASLLSPEGSDRMRARVEKLERDQKVHLALVTIDTSAPGKPSEHAFWLFNRWNVGDFDGDQNRGMLILLARNERRIECEVGFGLEEVVTDEAAGEILERDVVPVLAAGRVEQGLEEAVEIFARLIEGAGRPRPWWRVFGR